MIRARLAAMVALALTLGNGAAWAQGGAPLEATIFFDPPPANSVFAEGTPIRMSLLIRNVSGAPILTTRGFAATDFWRLLYFELDGVGTIAEASEALKHRDAPYGTCHYRNSATLPGAGIPVVPVEVLPADYAVQFDFDDARANFDLRRPGRYTVNARLSLYAYVAASVITDCNVEFGGQSLVSIGSVDVIGGRQRFDVQSNDLQFIVESSDGTPPSTTADASPPPNGAGWNAGEVTVTLTALDEPGGSGVKDIVVTLFGAEAGTQTIVGATGTVAVAGEGTTTVFFNAADNADNREPVKSIVVRVDRTAPVVTPPASITVGFTETGGARGSASPALATFLAAGAAVDGLDPAPARLSPQVAGVNADSNTLFSIGSTVVTFRFQDLAGNIGSANASVTVTAGTPVISVALGANGVQTTGIRFFDVVLTNTGTAPAGSVTVSNLAFQTLAGKGTVTLNTALSPPLPVTVGEIATGASATIRMFVNVAGSVSRFSITETGLFVDPMGATKTFTATQTDSVHGPDKPRR